MKRVHPGFFLIANWFIFFNSFILPAQTLPVKSYPQGYFRNPLNIPISLSGNFGELRPNHYHMGLDIKTMARENLPVHAAADGYVARVKIEPQGFGRAIYINHPNGYTTLYAHLNEFFPALESYVKQQQYKQQSWEIFIDVPPSLFPVHKGDFIANSGTTGGSQAPHLHFEVRRTVDDVNLNPMLFGLPLNDDTRPAILRLAVYDRTKSTYEQSPRLVTLKRNASGYLTSPGIIAVSAKKVSFAITAYDTHSGSSNLNGIYEALLYEDNKLVTGFQMDNISYNQTRYINAHIDYKTRERGGPFLQHLSELPGYVNSIYTKVSGDGVLDVGDGAVHNIRIVAKDAYGNSSELAFSVQFNGAAVTTAEPPGKKFYPLMLDVYESEDCEFYLGENCLYDSVHIRESHTPGTNPVVISAVHTIGADYIPLEDSFLVRIKPSKDIEINKRHRVVMQRFSGAKKDVQKVEWQDEWASARFRDLGSFQLVLDETPPVIVPVGFSNGASLGRVSRIVFTVRDNLEKCKNFRAELDGKWLRFTNDKGRSFIYRFDEMCPPGLHELKVSVEDEAGNLATNVYHFSR